MKRAKGIVLPPVAVSAGALGWLTAGLLVTFMRHVFNIPIWAPAFALLIALWRYRLMVLNRPLPSRTVRLLLTLAACTAVLLTFGNFLGRDPGITALVMLIGLKLLELKSGRDFTLVVLLCYFTLLVIFLYDQTIPDLLFTFAAVSLLTAALLRLHHPGGEAAGAFTFIKFSLKSVLLSLPFVVVLFLFFPRTPGAFLNLMPGGGPFGYSGFSEFIWPGRIARVAASDAVAFRVHFPDHNIPAQRDRYFRGLVLWFTDGLYWFQGKFPNRPARSEPVPGPTIRQEITLAPHDQRWLFALDKPVVFPGWSKGLPGHIFRAPRPIKNHLRYRVESQLTLPPETELHPVRQKWCLQRPRKINARLLRLAQTLKGDNPSAGGTVRAMLDYFRQEGFRYTTEPGTLNWRDPVADFLFNKRRGFCEHYASAFAFMMRLAGVPARVIVGYQGGEYNPVGDYLVVRQADAHAWCEVWLPGQGWTRIDPTAVVSPERLEYGIGMSRSLSGLDASGEADRSEAIQRALKRGFWKSLLQNLRYYWDTIDNHWNLWIISYDQFSQRDFLQNLGIFPTGILGLLLLTLLVSAVLYGTISYFLKMQVRAADPVSKAYLQFCRKLRRSGLQIPPWQGPLDLERRAKAALPNRAAEIHTILRLYTRLHYGRPPHDPHSPKQLSKHIRRFHSH